MPTFLFFPEVSELRIFCKGAFRTSGFPSGQVGAQQNPSDAPVCRGKFLWQCRPDEKQDQGRWYQCKVILKIGKSRDFFTNSCLLTYVFLFGYPMICRASPLSDRLDSKLCWIHPAVQQTACVNSSYFGRQRDSMREFQIPTRFPENSKVTMTKLNSQALAIYLENYLRSNSHYKNDSIAQKCFITQ